MRSLTRFQRVFRRRAPALALVACVLAAVVLPTTGVWAQTGPPGGGSYQGITPTYKNLKYASASSSEVLDIFEPSTKGTHPVIIFIHGGAFMFGSKEMLDTAPAQAFLKAGYAIASINYRLSGEAKFPAAVEDAKAAVRFLRANAAKYKLNTKKFAVWGESAGANIAQMLADTAGVKSLEGASLGNAKYSSAVRAVINQYVPNNFTLMDAELKAQGCSASDITHNQASSPESLYIGTQITKAAALVQMSNPINYITKKSPPTLVEKGSSDCTVPVQQSVLLYNALKKSGVKTQYVLLQGAGHGGPQFDTAANIKTMLAFLNSALK